MSDNEQAGPLCDCEGCTGDGKCVFARSVGDVIADVIFDAIDRGVANHLAAHPEDAAKFAAPDYSSPVISVLPPDPGHWKGMGPGGPKYPREVNEHGGPNWMLPGGPRYPRELQGVSPFPEYARDEIGYDYSPWLGYEEAKKLLCSPEEAEKRVRELYSHMSEEELIAMTRIDWTDFRGEGEAKRQSFQNVDGKWHEVVPGYNYDGSEVVLSDDWWNSSGLPSGFGRGFIPSPIAVMLSDPTAEELKASTPPPWNGWAPDPYHHERKELTVDVKKPDPWSPLLVETHMPSNAWAGYVPDYFIRDMAEKFIVGKGITLDMLYAPHPDPFQRLGKKGPPVPWSPRLVFWGHKQEVSSNSDFYNIWQTNNNHFFPRPWPIMVSDISLEDIKDDLAKAPYEFSREGHQPNPIMLASRAFGVSPDMLRRLAESESSRVPLLIHHEPLKDIDPDFMAALIESETGRPPLFTPAFVSQVNNMNDSLAEAIARISLDVEAHFKGISNDITKNWAIAAERLRAVREEFRKPQYRSGYKKPISSMRAKKQRYYALVGSHQKAEKVVYYNSITGGKRGEAPDVGEWILTPSEGSQDG